MASLNILLLVESANGYKVGHKGMDVSVGDDNNGDAPILTSKQI